MWMSSMMFPIFMRACNFLRKSAGWTVSPGLPPKSGTVMGADMTECCGKAATLSQVMNQ